MSEPLRLVVGRIGRPHGLSGEVSVLVRTDSPEQRFAPGAVFPLADGRRLTVRGTRWHRGALLMRLDGVTDRDAAEALRGAVLTVAAGELLVLAREGRPDALVPFVRDIVPTVDVAGGRLVLTPPDGLLD